jgi:outer membrane protein assembly factor BamB
VRRMVVGLLVLSVVAAWPTGVGAAGPREWAQYRYGPERTGFDPFERVLDPSNVSGLTQVWSATVGGALGAGVHSTPAVSNGVVYVASEDQHLYAFDAEAGTMLWSGALGGLSDSSPAVVDGVVYVGSNPGGLYAFPASCSDPCSPLWRAGSVAQAVNPAPAVADGVVYLSGYDGRLHALSARTGRELWAATVNDNDPIFGSPAVAGGTVFVPGDLGVYAFPVGCVEPCAPAWIHRTRWSVEHTPAVHAGTVFAVDDQGDVYALDAATGRGRWTASTSFSPTGATVADGTVYVAAGFGTMFAFPETCHDACPALWTVTVDQGLSTPVVANGVVYAGAINGIYFDGTLFEFPARCSSGCADLGSQAVDGAIESEPTVWDGRVYVGTITGTVAAFGLP